MCRIFAEQHPDDYQSETRSMRLNGYSTSVRLEKSFWRIIDTIAAEQDMTTPGFIATLHDEIVDRQGAPPNFTSMLRCVCLRYLSMKAGRPLLPASAATTASMPLYAD